MNATHSAEVHSGSRSLKKSLARADPGDVSEMEQLQIQTAQQKYDQAVEIASNAMKERADTGGAIVQNLKP
jgi:hypothetical protein